MQPIITISDLSKTYASGFQALKNINLEIGRGEIFALLGPNGAGKTTFAREFLPHEAHCPIFINADLIAAGLSPFMPELAAIKAGKLMLS